MGRNGDPLVRPEHLLDAAVVAAVVFFAILLSQDVGAILAGQAPELTMSDIRARIITALVGGALSFFAMWARSRGLDIIDHVNGDG